MNLELGKEEHGLLLDLVDSRVSELHPEIRHSVEHEFKDKLKLELECMRGLLEKLKALGAEKK